MCQALCQAYGYRDDQDSGLVRSLPVTSAHIDVETEGGCSVSVTDDIYSQGRVIPPCPPVAPEILLALLSVDPHQLDRRSPNLPKCVPQKQ